MELTKEQKKDRIRQSLYVFCQENSGLCRPVDTKFVVVFNQRFYVCDLVNKGEELFDFITNQLKLEFLNYRVGFKNNNQVAQYVINKFSN